MADGYQDGGQDEDSEDPTEGGNPNMGMDS